MPNSTKLSYQAVGKAFCFHGIWIFVFTMIVQILAQLDSSLFGLVYQEPFLSSLGYCPKMPFREWGLTIFTYPLSHVSLSHWLISAGCWLCFSYLVAREVKIFGLLKNLAALIFYGILSGVIAISFLLPMAPNSNEFDRILGLSAVVLFQIGFLLVLKPRSILWGIVFIIFYFGESSVLAQWGHGAGLFFGFFLGFIWRFYSSGKRA